MSCNSHLVYTDHLCVFANSLRSGIASEQFQKNAVVSLSWRRAPLRFYTAVGNCNCEFFFFTTASPSWTHMCGARVPFFSAPLCAHPLAPHRPPVSHWSSLQFTVWPVRSLPLPLLQLAWGEPPSVGCGRFPVLAGARNGSGTDCSYW
jgi:hypothetical protein